MRASFSLPRPAAVSSRLVNALLQREDWARTSLSQHGGKTVHFRAGSQTVRLTIDSTGLTQPCDPAIIPDVTLSIAKEHLRELPQRLRSDDPSDLTAIIHIEGDAALAQIVSELARDLRWDIEHDLAGRVGDIAARRVLRSIPLLSLASRRTTWRLARNAGEYLIHESELMANQPAVRRLSTDLDAALERLEALEARITKLEANRKETPDV